MNIIYFNLLYIDPGTGSMLFSILIGLAAAAVFGAKALFLKLKFLLTGGKDAKDAISAQKIPYVIYSDHKRYWNVFKPICDEFEKRKIPLVFYTSSSDDPALTEKYDFVKTEFIGEGNKAFARLNFLNAGTLLSTTPGLDVYQWKRSKNVDKYVHIPHTADDLAGYRMFGLDYYDTVLTTGKNQIELIHKIENLRPSIKRKELVTVGSITLDNLKKKLDEKQKCPKNKVPVILLAPSWGPSGILSRYGEKILTALKNTGYEIIVRPHPQTIVSEKNILDPLVDKFSDIKWNFDNDNFDVLNRADLLITDFSGIIFDYSLVFDKPLIYADTSFDTSVYDADWLDEKIWSLRAVEKLGIQLKEEDFDRMTEVIKEAISSKNLKAARDEIRKECWEFIGQSSVNTVDYLTKK